MLTNLHVKNLALIDEAEVSFGPGLNILTGETGAGKSILLGSINLALGQKMSKDLIRRDAESCLVELVFQVENTEILQKLKEMDVETEDGMLILSRRYQDGHGICRLNSETCTAAKIREISSLLLDIHGQHEHQSLLYKDKQLEILDAYGGIETEKQLAAAAAAYQAYRKVRKELDTYAMDSEEREREMSFLQFEISEIENASLKEEEEEELEKSYRRMSNSKKIAEAMGQVCRHTGEEEGAGDLISSAIRELASVTAYDEKLEGMARELADVDNLLNDFNREAADYLADFTFSEEEFYETEKRLDLINHLRSKYGKSIPDILTYLTKQKEKLENLKNFEERKKELSAEAAGAEKKLEEECRKLSENRQQSAAELSEKIRQGLHDLNFASVEFEILFTRVASYQKNGYDEIEFMISTNPGESLRPLSKVVSGGELSRIMLAIKTILADKDDTETLIFDEIDTGISGRTAQKVSEKMARISRNHQVLCITHLAQIAAMADRHFEIEKKIEKGQSVTKIHPLSREKSIEELARILGGAQITEAVLSNAREMKQLADERKRNL